MIKSKLEGLNLNFKRFQNTVENGIGIYLGNQVGCKFTLMILPLNVHFPHNKTDLMILYVYIYIVRVIETKKKYLWRLHITKKDEKKKTKTKIKFIKIECETVPFWISDITYYT